MLSVSLHYLALDGAYHLLKTPFSRYPTRSGTPNLADYNDEAFTLYRRCIQHPYRFSNMDASPTTPTFEGLRRRAIPDSIAFTKGILVSFFSSA